MISLTKSLEHMAWSNQKVFEQLSKLPDDIYGLRAAEGVEKVVNAFVEGGKNAILAGFDGIELHAANGYLLEQFLNPVVNDRDDNYGQSMESRCRIVLDIVERLSKAIGCERVGIRFSPYSTFNDMTAYSSQEVFQTYTYLAQKLQQLNSAYLHLSINPAILS